MKPQNGPLVVCEGGITHLGVRFRPDVNRSAKRLALVQRMLGAVFPCAVETPKKEWSGVSYDLVFGNQESCWSIVEGGITADGANKLLMALPDDPVDEVLLGNLPRQVLVAVSFKVGPIHTDHLRHSLSNKGYCVRHVSLAEPREVYDGYMLSLFVPMLTPDKLPEFEKDVREAMSFKF
jgi:hypothetical protein